MNESADIEVIKTILKKSREKFKTAQIDFDNERYDDSVSRLYYAVFHAISAVLLSRGLYYSTHGQTIGAFNREFIKTGLLPGSFTKLIEKLFNERQIGDYNVEFSIAGEVAQEDLSYTEEIVRACEVYLAKIYNVDVSYWREE